VAEAVPDMNRPVASQKTRRVFLRGIATDIRVRNWNEWMLIRGHTATMTGASFLWASSRSQS